MPEIYYKSIKYATLSGPSGYTMKKLNKLYIISLCVGAFCLADETKQFEPDQLRFREMVAARVSVPPIIDGIIDDEVWTTALAESGFLQFEPYNLSAPSEKTEARVVFDNDYIYIAINI